MADILFLKRTIPLAILSFSLITKWWHAVPVDGPDKFYWGFPLAFVGQGFHTSMSLQIFIAEFILDAAICISFWLLLFYILKRMDIRLPENIWVSRVVWSVAVSVVVISGTVIVFSDPVFHWKRPYQWEVKAVGYIFIWERTPYLHPDGQHPD